MCRGLYDGYGLATVGLGDEYGLATRAAALQGLATRAATGPVRRWTATARTEATHAGTHGGAGGRRRRTRRRERGGGVAGRRSEATAWQRARERRKERPRPQG